MSTPCKTVHEKIGIMRKLMYSFYRIKLPNHEIINLNGWYVSSYNRSYTVYDSYSNRVLVLGHKHWQSACVDEEDIAINGNYPFYLPPYENDEVFEKDKRVFVNSRLTEKRYNTIIKSDQIFNFMLGNSQFPDYETIELAKGVRDIIHKDLKNFTSLAIYIRHDLIDWNVIENIKELYVNTESHQ